MLTLNVQHANPARSRRQADWLAEQDTDVIVLTEVAPGGHAITQALGEHGFTVHVTDGGPDYLTLVASRIGKQEPVPGIQLVHLPHRCAAVRLHLDGDHTIGVVGLYVPSRGPQARRNQDKRAFQAAVTAHLPRMADDLAVTGPIVIAGDLNVLEPGHQPHHKVFGAWEYDFYTAFTAAGYGDAFRHLHPDTVDHSWYGRRSGDGYRFDHIFCSPISAALDCGYLHQPRTSGLSDHAAMTAVISIPT
ncbi:endonuclease/exonuclease/phosphatase family protein [Herbidospora mongoliensis]|uniref:endonuclease/exonuclease/phosphatase family protein n=1 Tax=Herbidospora mongoliensis TaxID=688067 RepID=UPI001471F931|nr:endonuclease/exonuclease/phosphatase family protein [Herbidospora mongoliensis]